MQGIFVNRTNQRAVPAVEDPGAPSPRPSPRTTEPSGSQGRTRKQRILTGLATEQTFDDPTGGAAYFLVFNKGELRVPISEKAAESVVSSMFVGSAQEPEDETEEEDSNELDSEKFPQEYISDDDDDAYTDEDGVGQI